MRYGEKLCIFWRLNSWRKISISLIDALQSYRLEYSRRECIFDCRGDDCLNGALWSAFGECMIAVVFLAYGLTKRPLHFNESNLIKKPMSVRTARLVYLPIGALFLFFGIRDLIRATH